MESNIVNINKTKPVMVTGATGYVAGWIVKRLLEEGVTVHAAVRDPSDTKKLAHLKDLADKLHGSIQFFEADLLEQGSYAKAMEGCSVVFHTASPFTMSIKDPQKELVDPALLGTRNVLDAVNRTHSVKRVVLTSSCVAIYGDAADQKNVANGIFTEENWNTTASLTYMPYSYSKTVAEQEAWGVAKKQTNCDLVVMNPSFVVGPGITPFATSESFKFIRQLGNGRMKSGIPDIGVAAVDVRDLAEAHLRAAFLPEANGRNIISGWNTSFPNLAKALLPRYEQYPIPRKKLPKWLVWLVGPLADKSITRRFVSRNVDYSLAVDNSKSIRELGLSYRPLQTTVQEMFQQMIDHNLIPKP